MSKDFERQIAQVRQVRALRVRARLKEQRLAAEAVAALQVQLNQAEMKVDSEESAAITLQRDGLKDLVNDSVTVNELLKFNKKKIRSNKRIRDAKSNSAAIRMDKVHSMALLDEKKRAVQLAQKKLMGIEEVITGGLWK